MASITTDQGVIHHEVNGRGKPVILLHGWLGSWGLWQDTMAGLNTSHCTYALDFWGFGESGKKRDSYAIQDFVSLVDQFMEKLGIARAPLVGHSMGGTVALMVAAQYPLRATRVVVIGSPIVSSSLAFLLKILSRKEVARMLFQAKWAFRSGLRGYSPRLCKDPRFADMMERDLNQTTIQSFLISISSLQRTDLRPTLSKIKLPLMGVYGDKDNVVHPDQWRLLLKSAPHTRMESVPKAGHFLMLGAPDQFIHLLKDFLKEETNPV